MLSDVFHRAQQEGSTRYEYGRKVQVAVVVQAMARVCAGLSMRHIERSCAAQFRVVTSGLRLPPPMASGAPPVHSICHAYAHEHACNQRTTAGGEARSRPACTRTNLPASRAASRSACMFF